MPDITLKGIPAAVHRKLKARALRNRRSLNSEAIACLERAVGPAPLDVQQLLGDVRALRTRIGVRTTEAEIDRFKNAGRR